VAYVETFDEAAAEQLAKASARLAEILAQDLS
jgi:hypothetical protein